MTTSGNIQADLTYLIQPFVPFLLSLDGPRMDTLIEIRCGRSRLPGYLNNTCLSTGVAAEEWHPVVLVFFAPVPCGGPPEVIHDQGRLATNYG